MSAIVNPGAHVGVSLWNAPRWRMDFETGLLLWLRADKGITLNGSNVSAWADQSGAGATPGASQSVAARQPAFGAATGPGGQPGVTFDAANTEWMTLGTITDASNDWTIVAVLNMTSTAGQQVLIGTSFNTLQPAGTVRPVVPPKMGGNDGTAWRLGGASTTGAQWLEWHWDSGAPSFEGFRDGVSIGSDTYDATLAFANTATLGATSNGANNLDGTLSELMIFNQLKAASALATIHSSISTRYGL